MLGSDYLLSLKSHKKIQIPKLKFSPFNVASYWIKMPFFKLQLKFSKKAQRFFGVQKMDDKYNLVESGML